MGKKVLVKLFRVVWVNVGYGCIGVYLMCCLRKVIWLDYDIIEKLIFQGTT